MPRKSTISAEQHETREEVQEAVDSGDAFIGKLDEILVYLHRMERRDRLRTTGGFVRGMLGLIPLALFVWSAWYFVVHGDEFMKKITTEAVRQSAEYSQGSLMEQLDELMEQQKER